MALGEMSEMILTGQRALPTKLEDAHYSYQYRDLESALRQILGSAQEF